MPQTMLVAKQVWQSRLNHIRSKVLSFIMTNDIAGLRAIIISNVRTINLTYLGTQRTATQQEEVALMSSCKQDIDVIVSAEVKDNDLWYRATVVFLSERQKQLYKESSTYWDHGLGEERLSVKEALENLLKWTAIKLKEVEMERAEKILEKAMARMNVR